MSDVDAMVGWLQGLHATDEQAAVTNTVMLSGDPGSGWLTCMVTSIPELPGECTWKRDITGLATAELSRIAHDHSLTHADTAALDKLGRIDAERAICDQYERAFDLYESDREAPDGLTALEGAVRALASGYRHRAGWQEGWKP